MLLHPQFADLRQQRGQCIARQDFGDEQDGIRAGDARFEKLVRVENKVFAQKRDANGLTDRT